MRRSVDEFEARVLERAEDELAKQMAAAGPCAVCRARALGPSLDSAGLLRAALSEHVEFDSNVDLEYEASSVDESEVDELAAPDCVVCSPGPIEQFGTKSSIKPLVCCLACAKHRLKPKPGMGSSSRVSRQGMLALFGRSA